MPDKPAGEKTEKPTSRRIEKAREEGQIAQSSELPSALTLIAILGICVFTGGKFVIFFSDLIREGLSARSDFFDSGDAFSSFFTEKMTDSLWIMAPFLASIVVAGVLACIVMGGITFTGKPLQPKMEELSPVTGFQRLFSMNAIVKLISSVAKIALISAIVVWYTWSRIDELSELQWYEPSQLLSGISDFLLGALVRICIALLAIAISEAAYQKYKYNKNMMMTKQEIKEERKSQDGSPEIKSKIRQLQMKMASRRMLQDVPDSSVIIVNPTHYAVAIKYDTKNTPAPIVVAKGTDNMCEKIKEIARAHGVPIVRRPPLARNLYSNVDIGQMVPESLFVAVAEVLAMIYRIRHNR